MDTLPAKPLFSIPPSTEPRRPRRPRDKGLSQQPNPPSSTDKKVPTSPRAKAGEPPVLTAAFPEGGDFIPFDDSGPELEKTQQPGQDQRERKRSPPTREWDRGKVRVREPSPPSDQRKRRERSWERDEKDSGRKRKHDTTFDDGYENKKQRTDAASRKAPWVSDVNWESCTNVAEMLHREVEAFVTYISPTPVEDEIRGLVVNLISKAVTAAFPDAQVMSFGSFETKLYLPLGDIDLVILSDSMAYSNKANVLRALANTIKSAQLADQVTIIAKAKVPIVKFVTKHGRFKVDISINQSNGVAAGRIINGFLTNLQSTALRSIIMITKTFLSQRSMNEVFTGGLGSYSIVCLAVSFLQMHPKIRRGEIDAERNLGVLVMEFFELYGCYFNYEEVGISVRDGGTYFNKKERGWLDYSRRHLLSIEDPADPENDISRGTFAIAKVRTTFAGAHGILTAAAYLRAGLISARRNGRSINLRGYFSPDDMSILSSVMGVTQETINHRKLVQEVYDKRTLHQMLGVKTKEPIARPIPEAARTTARGRKAKPSSFSKRGAESVRSAWVEADVDDDGHSGASERRGKKESCKRQEEDSGEDGRYSIRKQQFSKTRRIVFTTDEEEGEIDEVITEYPRGDSSDEQEEVEEVACDLVVHKSGSRRRDRPVDGKAAERRDYWLSKAIALGQGESD